MSYIYMQPNNLLIENLYYTTRVNQQGQNVYLTKRLLNNCLIRMITV